MLRLRIYPDDVLRQPCEPVSEFDTSLHSLLDAMKATMIQERGVGLAANQVGVTKRIFIADVSPLMDEENTRRFGPPQHEDLRFWEFINPIIKPLDQPKPWTEGCLSFPSLFFEISRPHHIEISAQDRFGRFFSFEAKNILAICCQHEFDHLEGKVFLDYVSLAKRQSALQKLKKIKKSREN